MARLILCSDCNSRYSAGANKYNELFESIQGKALMDMMCDGAHATPTYIKKGYPCFAAVLLPHCGHKNYETQKPSAWADKYISQ